MTVALVALSLMACAHENNEDHAAMNRIPMQSVCVGRMLVDLPTGGRVDWQQQFFLATVERLPYSANTTDAFWTYVSKRKTEFEAPTAARPRGTLGVYKKIGNDAVIMQFRDPDVADLEGYYTERYLWLGHWGYKYTTGGLYDNQAAELLHWIEGTFSQVQPVDNLSPPSTPGFCIDGALVTGKIGPIWSSPSATVNGWKGVSVDAGAREDDGSRAKPSWQEGRHPLELPSPFKALELKEEAARESMRSDDEDRVIAFDVLRKQHRSLAGMPGEETAFRIKLANGQEYYRFDWNSIGDPSRPRKSGFSLDLEAGNYQYVSDYAPPPPQDDLLALWDAMLDSVKPRPGAR